MARSSGGAGWLRHPAFAPVTLVMSVALLALAAGLIVAPRVAGVAGATASGAAQPVVEVYIIGAVAHPGVYRITTGGRVIDLLSAAGGALTGADLARVNLAAPLFDGEEIYVPLIGEPFPQNTADGVRINLNTASATSLKTFLGISSKTATAIVAYRQTHGPYTSVDQLLLVPISRTIYDRIKNLVTV